MNPRMTKSDKHESAFTGSYLRVAEAAQTYEQWRYLSLLAGLLLVMFLGNSWFLQLDGSDEVRVAGIGLNMAQTGNYMVPYLNGRIFLEYPPLYYFCQSFFFDLLGPTALAAKMPSMLSAVIGALAIYFLVRAMKYPPITAFFSGLILASSSQYFNNGMTGMVDSMLAMFAIIAWWGFYAWGVKEQRHWRCLWFVLLVVGLAGGMMTKNLPGLVIPLSGIGIFMVVNDIINRAFHFGRFVMLFLATLLALLPMALYCYMLYCDYGIEPVKTLLVYNNFGRFSGSAQQHSEPFYYYFTRMAELFQPWMVFLLIALPFHFKRVVKKHSLNSLYSLCILLVPFILLCISSGKRQVYLLPLYAPDAILVGTMFGMFVEGKIVRFSDRVNDLIIKSSFYVIFALGLITPVVFVILGICFDLPGWGRYWAAVLMFVLTMRVWQLAKPRQEGQLLKYMAVIFAMIYPNITGIALAYRAQNDTFEPMFEAAAKHNKLYLDRPRESIAGAAVFYLHHEVPEINLLNHSSELKPGDAVLTVHKKLIPADWRQTVYNDRYILAEVPNN